MSSINQTQLNPGGQVVLAGAASFISNGFSQPLSTIQTCLQARKPIPWMTDYKGCRIPLVRLFTGLNAVCAVDAITLGMAYITNDVFKKHLGPIGAIVAASAVTSPLIAVGEGAMQNRQANGLNYTDPVLLKRAIRLPGIVTTLNRELFWNLGLFYITPKMAEKLKQKRPDLSPSLSEMLAAIGTGSVVGFMTTPVSVIKTMIQTSEERLTVMKAIRNITSPPIPLSDGPLVRSAEKLQGLYNRTKPRGRYLKVLKATEGLFAGAVPRVFYVALFMSTTDLAYRIIPGRLPDVLKI